MRILVPVTLLLAALAVAGAAQAQVPGRPLAEVNGQWITESDLNPLIGPQMRHLVNQAFELRRRALEEAINQKIVAGEAARRGLSAEKLV